MESTTEGRVCRRLRSYRRRVSIGTDGLFHVHECGEGEGKSSVNGSKTYGYVQLLETSERVSDSRFVQL